MHLSSYVLTSVRSASASEFRRRHASDATRGRESRFANESRVPTLPPPYTLCCTAASTSRRRPRRARLLPAIRREARATTSVGSTPRSRPCPGTPALPDQQPGVIPSKNHHKSVAERRSVESVSVALQIDIEAAQTTKQEVATQDGAGAEAGSSTQTLLTLLADGEEQARQLGEMMADDPWSRAEHYRGAARRLQCTLGKAAAVVRAVEAAAPGSSSQGTDRSNLARSADESSCLTTAATEVQERQSMYKRRKGLPRWTTKLRVPDATLEATPDDGFSWRKYGQKDILGAKFPRGYYRCTYRTTQACAATKQVQRSDTDLCVFDVTYQGEHTCHQKQRATVAAHGGSQSPPPPAPMEQQQEQAPDPSMMQLLGMGFKRVLKVETAGLHDRDRGPSSAPAASFSFPSVPQFHHPGDATTTENNPPAAVAAAFSPPASSSYFPAPQPVVVDGSCYADVYDYDEATGARMRGGGAESSELGEVVTRAITAPAAFDYSSLFHHQAEFDDPHLPFPPFGGPPHGPYQ